MKRKGKKGEGKSYNLNLPTIILFLTFSLHSAFPLNNTVVFKLATGSPKGVYYQLGNWISYVAKKEGLKIEILGSKGAAENLYLVSRGEADLGIVQSDIAYNAYNALGGFKEKTRYIKAIGSLYTEAIHIVVRNPLTLAR